MLRSRVDLPAWGFVGCVVAAGLAGVAGYKAAGALVPVVPGAACESACKGNPQPLEGNQGAPGRAPHFSSCLPGPRGVVKGFPAERVLSEQARRPETISQAAEHPHALNVSSPMSAPADRQAGAYCLEGHLASPPDEPNHHPVADAPGAEPIPAHPPKRADGLRLSS